jgi:hypothetical protein
MFLALSGFPAAVVKIHNPPLICIRGAEQQPFLGLADPVLGERLDGRSR